MRNSKDVMIGLLIERLGGEVTITAEDFRRADRLEVIEWEDLPGNGYRYTTARPPVVLQGEIVTEPAADEYAEGWQDALAELKKRLGS